jgi:NAD+ synthase (glutamine-hydrolysing)
MTDALGVNVKLALFQMNPLVGAPQTNLKKILVAAKSAHAQGADALIAPELAICGYLPKDLLFRGDMIGHTQLALQQLAQQTPLPVILGAPLPAGRPVGLPLTNSVVLCERDQVRPVAHKRLIPTYDIFDEWRYFRPGPQEGYGVVEIAGERLGITICEDAWNDPSFWPHHRYDEDPVAAVVAQDIVGVINVAASPFDEGKIRFRESLFKQLAQKHRLPFWVCGQTGAHDHLIFDGGSLVLNASGDIVGNAPAFEEHLLLSDFKEQKVSAQTSCPPLSRFEQLEHALCLGIRDYITKCGVKKVLVGLSGGIDSAVTAALAVKALGSENVMGVRMPSGYSSDHSLKDADDLAANLGIECQTVTIEPIVESLRAQLQPAFEHQPAHSADITDQNLQARARGIVLMGFSNRTGAMVLTTGNKSEVAVGYATLYGDMCGALAPIADVWKTDVYALANFMNKDAEIIPRSTIIKPPSAELKPGQTDQDSLLPYDILDAILQKYIEEELGFDLICSEVDCLDEEVEDVLRKVDRSEYKRWQSACILRVSKKAFGDGRRMPVAAGFKA